MIPASVLVQRIAHKVKTARILTAHSPNEALRAELDGIDVLLAELREVVK